MCGIAGIARLQDATGEACDTLARMVGRLRHRGPDDQATLWNAQDRLGLAHARLSVLDLSPAGAQPMESASRRFAICFNGEICNAPTLARELRGSGWRPRGHSDTEVMLAAFEAWGVDGALTRFAGMFAIALHDRLHRTLHLVRDRLGIKPLHWAWIPQRGDRALVFASELRALLQVPAFERRLDTEAITRVLSHGCVTGDRCVWSGAHKLPPGHRLELDLVSGEARSTCWWSAIDAATRGVRVPFQGTDAEAIDRASKLLDGVVHEHLASDVPLGCFLSGGVDSATVASAARVATPEAPIRAFTAGFDHAAFDERTDASLTARALGMPLTELVVHEAAMLDAVARMVEVHDEPFADSSQIPTWLLCGEMRRHVKVALSGDGGDEAFGGYHRHVHAAEGWPRSRRLPSPFRRIISGAARALSPEAWDVLARPLRPALPTRLRVRSAGASLHKWARCIGAASERAAYQALTDVRGDGDAMDAWWHDAEAARLPDFLRRMQFMDQTGYLVDDVLVKVDRASMAHGLEVRVPLLDHRVIEFAWSLPPRMKVRDGRGKWLLRELLARRVPRHVIDAPKRGFAVPLGAWLRGPLRQWAGDLLSPGRLRREPLLDAARLDHAWRRLQAGSDAPQHELWCALMYIAWSDRWNVTP